MSTSSPTTPSPRHISRPPQYPWENSAELGSEHGSGAESADLYSWLPLLVLRPCASEMAALNDCRLSTYRASSSISESMLLSIGRKNERIAKLEIICGSIIHRSQDRLLPVSSMFLHGHV